MNQSLVILEDGIPLTTSYIMAEKLGVEHRSLMQLIKDHQEKIERHFGLMRFENAEIEGRGRPEQFARPTENQAHYILTLSRNTEQAMEVKALFVKAFAEAKQQVQILQAQLTDLSAQLNNLPTCFASPTDIDCAWLATNRMQLMLNQLRELIESASKARRITSTDVSELIRVLRVLNTHTIKLTTTIDRESATDDTLTRLLFEYREALLVLAPQTHRWLPEGQTKSVPQIEN